MQPVRLRDVVRQNDGRRDGGRGHTRRVRVIKAPEIETARVEEKEGRSWVGVALPLAVFALAALVYGLYGFNGPLYRDYGIYLYGGQQMAAGVPPYAGIFDHKGPVPVVFAGLGVALSGPLGMGDVHAVRAVFFVTGCLSAVSVYLLGRSVFRSRMAGLLSGLTFLCFQAYSASVASGPEPKTPLVLFEALGLTLTIRKRWFWAGVFGSLSFLTWQPTAIVLMTSFVMAAALKGERWRALARLTAGAAAPFVVTGAYYLYTGAVKSFLEGFLLFNLLRVHRSGEPPYLNPLDIADPVIYGYGAMLTPLIIGLAVVVFLYFLKPLQFRYAALLISLPLFAVWSVTDFQVPEDFYVLLPYAAVGFGAVLNLALGQAKVLLAGRGGTRALTALVIAALVASAVLTAPQVNQRARRTPSLQEQQASAAKAEKRFKDGRIVSINAPQIMALLHRKNPNIYLFTTDGVDRQIAAEYPGGWEGWIRNIKRYDPVAIAAYAEGQRQLPNSDITVKHGQELYDWLISAGYRPEKIGTFWFYVKEPSRLSQPS